MKYIFGVDIGATTVKFGCFSDAEKLLNKWEIKTRKEDDGSWILSDVAKSIREYMVGHGLQKQDVLGIGIGIPGPVREDGSVNHCVNLGWGIVNVRETMYDLLGIPVAVGNDANVAALGEVWKGGGKDHKSIVMITLGSGVGGGVVMNGKIVHGNNGAAGEIGHIHMRDDETVPCGCGNFGCLEQYASANGVKRMAERLLVARNTHSTLRQVEEVTAKSVFDAAKQGDSLALEIVEEFAETLGRALAAISCVIDPEAFVIGGGVSKAGAIVITNVQKAYLKYCFHASRATEIKLATLDNDAGIWGCAKMSFQLAEYLDAANI